MDVAVALTQAYLEAHGYFTLAEYNVLELLDGGKSREATDLDILAVRFPGERTPGALGHTGSMAMEMDPQLGVDTQVMDMIVGEVKQGRARFNAATRSAGVLEAALVRFGCCSPSEVTASVAKLLHDGIVSIGPEHHRVRLVAFGSTGVAKGRAYQTMTHERMLSFLKAHLRRHWSLLGQVHLMHPTLAMLALELKARPDSERRRVDTTHDEGSQ